MLGAWMCAIAGVMGLPPMRVAINIPAYRLDVYVADTLVRSMPVAPGTPRFRTPRGVFAISSVEWNPWWIPPPSPWAARDRPMAPGPANPMGRVKLNFLPLYYLHGTPLAGSIGSAASHGCIRLFNADAIELARLVHRFGSPWLSADDVARLAADTVTTRVLNLDHAVPLEIRYDLVEIRGGRLTVYRDVYQLASGSLLDAVYSALTGYGVAATSIDPVRVRALVREVPSTGREVPVDSLLRGRPRRACGVLSGGCETARAPFVRLEFTGTAVRKTNTKVQEFPRRQGAWRSHIASERRRRHRRR